MKRVEWYKKYTIQPYSKPVRDIAGNAVHDIGVWQERVKDKDKQIVELRQKVYRLSRELDRRYI